MHTVDQPVEGHISVAGSNSPDATGTDATGLDYAPEKKEIHIFRHYACCAIWHFTVMQIYV